MDILYHIVCIRYHIEEMKNQCEYSCETIFHIHHRSEPQTNHMQVLQVLIKQCNLSSRTNQSRTWTSINPFLVNFNRPTCRTQETISQHLGGFLRTSPLDLWLPKIKEWCLWGIIKHGYDAPSGLSHGKPSSKTTFLSDVNEASLPRLE